MQSLLLLPLLPELLQKQYSNVPAACQLTALRLLPAPAPAASMDERSAQVVRISKVLAQHAAGLADATAAQAAEQPPDPYEVLGLEEGAAPGEVGLQSATPVELMHAPPVFTSGMGG